MKACFKQLEECLRTLRCYLSPQAHRTYRHLLERGMAKIPTGARSVALDLTDTALDEDGGRYFYYLIQDILAAGYYPVLKANYRFLATFSNKRFKAQTIDLPIGIYKRDIPDGCSILMTDHVCDAQAGIKLVHLDYSVRLAQGDNELNSPYCCHPASQAREAEFSALQAAHPRSNKVFYAGANQRPKYANPEINGTYGLVNRADAVDKILEALDTGEISHEGLKFCHQASDRIASQEWLGELGESTFFLAFPGVKMPLSHNLIEALAVGTIPILEYPQYLEPPLQDGINCLVYSGADELISTIKRAENLDAEQVSKYSQAAREYYQQHLSLGNLTRRIIAQPSPMVTVLPFSWFTPL